MLLSFEEMVNWKRSKLPATWLIRFVVINLIIYPDAIDTIRYRVLLIKEKETVNVRRAVPSRRL